MSLAKFQRYTRLMLGGAALILVLMASLHGTGFAEVDAHLVHAPMPEIWRNAVRVVWIMYSAHLLLIAGILTYAALSSAPVPGPVLMLCGAIPALDALLMLFYVGGFIGTLVLGLAAALVFGAVARRNMPAHEDPAALSRR
jgi:hypothetical protein